MMKKIDFKMEAALFDFDGVIMDTEGLYTIFWDEVGSRYLGVDGFGASIKGQTLTQIFERHLKAVESQWGEITEALNVYERDMKYQFIPGAAEYLLRLREEGVPTAIVTSSNEVKMKQVMAQHPELPTMVDRIFTAEYFTKSKPDPQCFLLGMEAFGSTPAHTIVFEDSFHGLEAGRASGAFVVGLATTNSREAIAPLCDVVIDDFVGWE